MTFDKTPSFSILVLLGMFVIQALLAVYGAANAAIEQAAGWIHPGGQQLMDISEQLDKNLQVVTYETKSLITSAEGQTITVGLYSSGQPLAGQIANLKVFQPNGSAAYYVFPATGEDGLASLALPPILAANGTLIIYETCVRMGNEKIQCESESYIIWGNQSSEGN